jgi:DNA ligase-4
VPRLISTAKRYFFYASLARQATDDYNLEDEENEHEATPADLDDDAVMVPVEEKSITPKIEQDEIDPAMVEWLKIDDTKSAAPIYVNDDSETEADSDNADVAEPGEDAVELDEWLQVQRPENVWIFTNALLVAYVHAIGRWRNNHGRNGGRDAI